jgi:hypothetical protein
MSLETRSRLVGVTVALLLAAAAASAETLRTVLSGYDVPADGAPRWLDEEFTASAAFSDDRLFAIAGDRAGGGDSLPDTFEVLAFDRRTKVWRSATLPRRHRNRNHRWDVGTFDDLRRGDRHFYLEAHLNPSAATTLVLTDALTVESAVDGWLVAALPRGDFLFEHSAIHFAPTHSAEIWLYSSGTRTSRPIYPKAPYGPVRAAYIDTVRAVYERLGPDWMREHNHHGDPQQFDSALLPPVLVSERGNIAAFLTRFGTTDSFPGSTPAQDVAVVCDGLPGNARCRESRLDRTAPASEEERERLLRAAIDRTSRERARK